MKKLDQIVDAMNALGGHSSYEDLYTKLLELYPDCADNCKDIKTWKATVRGTIERYSSDSECYKGKCDDLFYSIEGIGKGCWGLRNPILTEEHVDISNDDEGFVEGKEILKKHIIRERNHYIKTKAINKFKVLHNGKVYCEICGFNFEDKYGKIGENFIEVHHTKPVSEMKEGEKTKIEDLALLCSNCHSMIHRKRPWLSKDKSTNLLFKGRRIKYEVVFKA